MDGQLTLSGDIGTNTPDEGALKGAASRSLQARRCGQSGLEALNKLFVGVSFVTLSPLGFRDEVERLDLFD